MQHDNVCGTGDDSGWRVRAWVRGEAGGVNVVKSFEREYRTIYELLSYSAGKRSHIGFFETSELVKEYLEKERHVKGHWFSQYNCDWMSSSPDDGYIIQKVMVATAVIEYETDSVDAMMGRGLSARRRVTPKAVAQ